jgi:hypothetical protein
MEAGRHDPTRLRRRLQEFSAAPWPPIDGESAARLKQIAKTAQEAAAADETWIRETVPFTTEDNLRALLLAAGLTKSRVEPLSDGSGWRCYEDTGLPVIVRRLRYLDGD